jgi:signal transduction histidine kinase
MGATDGPTSSSRPEGGPVPVVRAATRAILAVGATATVVAVLVAVASGTGWVALAGILAAGVVATAVGGVVVRGWVRAIDRELAALGAGVSRIAADPARARLPMRRQDEIGALAQALDQLRARFRAALDRERAARRELEEADAAKDAFLMAVRHELRTPLNAILGFADVLLSEIDGPLTKGQQEDARIILSSGNHLASLFDDVLDLSAAVSQQLDLEVEEIDLVRLLRDVIREQRPQARGKELTLVLDAPDEALLLADPKRLRQVFTNLVANAVKFTERGRVEVVVRESEPTVVVEVRDTGVGIPDDQQATIFDEFLQVPETKGKRERRIGAGLGLAIARNLVELHEGRIVLWSEPGEGSVFTVRLPVAGPIGADPGAAP